MKQEVECGQFADRMGPVRSRGGPTQSQQFHGLVGLNNWLNEWIMASLILGHLSLKAWQDGLLSQILVRHLQVRYDSYPADLYQLAFGRRYAICYNSGAGKKRKIIVNAIGFTPDECELSLLSFVWIVRLVTVLKVIYWPVLFTPAAGRCCWVKVGLWLPGRTGTRSSRVLRPVSSVLWGSICGYSLAEQVWQLAGDLI